jgi:hypothetical protein
VVPGGDDGADSSSYVIATEVRRRYDEPRVKPEPRGAGAPVILADVGLPPSHHSRHARSRYLGRS